MLWLAVNDNNMNPISKMMHNDVSFNLGPFPGVTPTVAATNICVQVQWDM